MAASQTTIALRNSTNAEFRAIGAFIYAGLIAGGWTRVATDIDWTTVNAPAQNTYAGTEIWQSPAEGGLTQFYLRLRHGSNNAAAPAYALEWQIGWAWTSGLTLGGIPTTAVSSQANITTGAATTRLCTIAAGEGYLALCLGSGGTNGCHLLVIERTRDAALAPQNELVIVSTYYAGAYSNNNKIYTSDSLEITNTSAYNAAGSWFPYPTTAAATQISRGAVALAFMTPRRFYATSPVANFLGAMGGALGNAGEQIPISVYGVSRTFMILSGTNVQIGCFDGNNLNNGLIRYD